MAARLLNIDYDVGEKDWRKTTAQARRSIGTAIMAPTILVDAIIAVGARGAGGAKFRRQRRGRQLLAGKQGGDKWHLSLDHSPS